ncbi:hypothetical protein C8Q78DRAFT_973872 [Trametes maxima]|nr:hypothetical protein C8Q78DRAFT_973872 [Trametes maxima]
MMKSARRFGAKFDVRRPVEVLKKALPIWSHIAGTTGAGIRTNTATNRCLSKNHAVQNVSSATEIVRRLERIPLTIGVTQHKNNVKCECTACTHDREVLKCANPHKCAVAAKTLLEKLKPEWAPGNEGVKDGLSMTRGRKRMNARARTAGEDMLFNPSIKMRKLKKSIRVFTEGNELELGPTRTAVPFAATPEIITANTDGSAIIGDDGTRRAGSGVWFGNGHPNNVAERVPGDVQTNQVAEIYAANLALKIVPPYIPLRIRTDSKLVTEGFTKHLKGWEVRGWTGVANAGKLQEVAACLHA